MVINYAILLTIHNLQQALAVGIIEHSGPSDYPNVYGTKRKLHTELLSSQHLGYSGSNLYAQRNSSLEAIGWDTFVSSFHWGTWLAILVLLGIMTVGVWIIVHHQTDEDDHFTKGSNIVFILFSCLVQQGDI